jgi:hypothetical protein
MSPLVALSAPAPAAVVGGKFANLARHHADLPVPPAVAVGRPVFRAALAPLLSRLELHVQELAATNGASLTTSVRQIQDLLAGLRVPDECRRALRQWLPATRAEGTQWCVRSSATDEDRHASSAAGVYRSELALPDLDEICDAIVRCWRGYFETAAIGHRLRQSTVTTVDGMAVIVQRMVPATLAGVAIAENGRLLALEYVDGVGDRLVGGLTAPYRYEPGSEPVPRHAVALHQASGLAAGLSVDRGERVDVEWAFDGTRTWLLQVRPVARGHQRQAVSATPHFQARDLYAPPAAGDPGLGALHQVCSAVRRKRVPLFRAARRHHIPTVRGSIITFNRAGVAGRRWAESVPWFADSPGRHVVIDVDPQLRQIVVDRSRVSETLLTLSGSCHGDTRVFPAMVREFVEGECGIITRTLPGRAEVLIEWSRAGLVSLNRGTAAACRSVTAASRIDPEVPAAVGAADGELRRAVDFTVLFDAEQPGAQLEWVVTGGRLVLVDFSRDPRPTHLHTSGRVMSLGKARGPVFVLADDPFLNSLSISPAVNSYGVEPELHHRVLDDIRRQLQACEKKPIVFVDRPYASLAAVLDLVAGFVFREGGLLSHLALLLRERNLPGVLSAVPAPEPDGAWVALNGADISMVTPQSGACR